MTTTCPLVAETAVVLYEVPPNDKVTTGVVDVYNPAPLIVMVVLDARFDI